MTPLKNNVVSIKLVQPWTSYPRVIFAYTIQNVEKIELIEVSIPSIIANFNGLSENDNIMSVASLIRFL